MVLMFIGGLIALGLGAESLVRGASRLAIGLGISPLVVGLTVVSFGTSAPELAVAVGAVLDGRTAITFGNVIGSNIFNVLFILGLSAVITPLVVNRQIIRQEVPIMIGAALLLLLLGFDGQLSFSDSFILLTLMIAYTVFLVLQSRREGKNVQEEYAQALKRKSKWDSHWSVQLALILVGLGLLVLGSNWLVDASVTFARSLGVSDVIIGLTIVAVGTSLPEVATSIMAAIRGERDIAVGNIVGSNIFNILGSLGVAGIFSSEGLRVTPAILNFDIWVMLAATFACLPVFLTGRKIARWEGGIFLSYYVGYTAYLILAAQGHEALQPFSRIMLSFVFPLTLVTMVVMLIQPGNLSVGKEKASPLR